MAVQNGLFIVVGTYAIFISVTALPLAVADVVAADAAAVPVDAAVEVVVEAAVDVVADAVTDAAEDAAVDVAVLVAEEPQAASDAAITIVTSLAGSLGIVLGGSLIVETLFDINGFGKFFYEAVINRDYNVIMFSALAGSFLTLVGYLCADLAYMWLDPRITLD